jgi:hypothetical protein
VAGRRTTLPEWLREAAGRRAHQVIPPEVRAFRFLPEPAVPQLSQTTR